MQYACSTCGATSPTRRCPNHGGNTQGNTSYNGTRNRQEQAAFRRMLIQRDGLKCWECDVTTNLQAHHTSTHDGRLLCPTHHREVDQHAR